MQKASMPPKALRKSQLYHLGSGEEFHSQSPLRDRYRDEPVLAETMLHRGLERVRTAELRVNDNQPDRPVDRNRQSDEENQARHHARLTHCVWLSDDTRTTTQHRQNLLQYMTRIPYMILFAMFMNAFSTLLRGFALSRYSSGSSSSPVASVTLGASMSVSSGNRCPELFRRPRSISPR